MTDIKHTIRLEYVVNLGNYQRLEVEVTKQYPHDTGSSLEVTEFDTKKEITTLDTEMREWMKERGIEPTIGVRSVPRK